MDKEILKKRLKETFGKDVQYTIANKLHMSQSNVSKMLSGSQLPTIDVLENISKKYCVSVDWLLGLSNKKHTQIEFDNPTYGEAVKIIFDLEAINAINIRMSSEDKISLKLKDPLLKRLINKGKQLREVDYNYYQRWRDKCLSVYSCREVIDGDIWKNVDDLIYKLYAAESDEELVEVCDEAFEEGMYYLLSRKKNYGRWGDF